MLTRYEEVVKSVKDEHERFPARASLAYREGFLMRPIVNEYLGFCGGPLRSFGLDLSVKKEATEYVSAMT